MAGIEISLQPWPLKHWMEVFAVGWMKLEGK